MAWSRKIKRDVEKYMDMKNKPRPQNCECDNTHEQNKTCCRSCWKAGFRVVNPGVSAPTFQRRTDRIMGLLGGDAEYLLKDAGLDIGDQPKRFIALEKNEQGDILWAMFADDLIKMAREIEQSETTGVERLPVYDLDAPDTNFHTECFVPVWAVTKFVKTPRD